MGESSSRSRARVSIEHEYTEHSYQDGISETTERQLAWYTKGFSLRVLLRIPGKPQTQNLLSSTSCVLEFLSPQHPASLLSFEIPVRNKVKVSNKHTLRLLRQIANYWAGLIKEQNMRTERKTQPPLLKLPYSPFVLCLQYN